MSLYAVVLLKVGGGGGGAKSSVNFVMGSWHDKNKVKTLKKKENRPK